MNNSAVPSLCQKPLLQPLPVQVFLCQPQREMPGAGTSPALLEMFAGMSWGIKSLFQPSLFYDSMYLALTSRSLCTLPMWVALCVTDAIHHRRCSWALGGLMVPWASLLLN